MVVHFTLRRERWEYERTPHSRCSANEHGVVSSGASPFATGLSQMVQRLSAGGVDCGMPKVIAVQVAAVRHFMTKLTVEGPTETKAIFMDVESAPSRHPTRLSQPSILIVRGGKNVWGR
ncbi:hypothetical protein BHM03_00057668 [Ensete ventricosum]|nr:hypothetical protein BHM03_00057668 [Ensete ventricosum]